MQLFKEQAMLAFCIPRRPGDSVLSEPIHQPAMAYPSKTLLHKLPNLPRLLPGECQNQLLLVYIDSVCTGKELSLWLHFIATAWQVYWYSPAGLKLCCVSIQEMCKAAPWCFWHIFWATLLPFSLRPKGILLLLKFIETLPDIMGPKTLFSVIVSLLACCFLWGSIFSLHIPG